ncbi:MAG: hypothetical protein IJC16_04210, partial [Rikenellaceae bacterium]|nr:hypothetical protein [Rikenellaceae bacterium]
MDLKITKQISIHAFDTSSLHNKYLACYGDRSFEITEATAQLIGILQHAESVEDAAIQLSRLKKNEYTAEDIKAIGVKCIDPIVKSGITPRNKIFLFKVQLIPAEVISIAAKALVVLFRPFMIAFFVTALVSMETWFYFFKTSSFRPGHIDLYTLLGVIGLYICSSLFHELGHASACRHFGVNHGGIGFALYMNFPVFYTD